jgi:plastocyanin
MNKLVAGVALAATILVSVVAIGPGALASTATKSSKPPVKISGKVNVAGTGTATGGNVSINLTDFQFSPTFIKVPSGTTSVTVTLQNNGTHPHTFTVPSASVDQLLNPGQTATVTVTIPSKGATTFFCRFHRSLGMQGSFFGKVGDKPIATPSAAGATATTTATTKAPTSSGGYGY